jgi:HK97 family phage major capsid protein
LGILNAPATVTVTKESGQASATVVPQNLAGMISRLAPGSFSRAKWFAHSSVLAQLFVLAVKIQNAAASDFVGGFGPNWFTVDSDGAMSLLGRPLIVSDRCQQLGTAGDLVLADLSQYAIPIRGDMKLAVDSSYGFRSDETWLPPYFQMRRAAAAEERDHAAPWLEHVEPVCDLADAIGP